MAPCASRGALEENEAAREADATRRTAAAARTTFKGLLPRWAASRPAAATTAAHASQPAAPVKAASVDRRSARAAAIGAGGVR